MKEGYANSPQIASNWLLGPCHFEPTRAWVLYTSQPYHGKRWSYWRWWWWFVCACVCMCDFSLNTPLMSLPSPSVNKISAVLWTKAAVQKLPILTWQILAMKLLPLFASHLQKEYQANLDNRDWWNNSPSVVTVQEGGGLLAAAGRLPSSSTQKEPHYSWSFKELTRGMCFSLIARNCLPSPASPAPLFPPPWTSPSTPKAKFHSHLLDSSFSPHSSREKTFIQWPSVSSEMDKRAALTSLEVGAPAWCKTKTLTLLCLLPLTLSKWWSHMVVHAVQ